MTHLKNRTLVTVLLLWVAVNGFSVRAATPTLSDGNAAYVSEDYPRALEIYSELIGEGYFSAELFYNTGNAYYRTGDIGKSIWAYEKALRIDPSNEDIQSNLAFVNNQAIDQIDNSKPGVGTWLQSVLFFPKVNFWSWTSLGFSLLFALSLILYFSAKTSRKKSLGLLLGGLFGGCTLFSAITAHQHKLFITEHNQGIIVADDVHVKVSPVEKSKDSFTLNSGSKVQLLGGNDEWMQIEINGNTGWVKLSKVWMI